jgi:hypothetical protein
VVKSLEHASLAARLTNLVGKPVELIGYAMPSFASKAIAATSRGLEVALKVALRTLPRSPRPAQLRRVGDDCRLWRARAVWVIEPCPAGYLCNGRQCSRHPNRYRLRMAGNPERDGGESCADGLRRNMRGSEHAACRPASRERRSRQHRAVIRS